MAKMHVQRRKYKVLLKEWKIKKFNEGVERRKKLIHLERKYKAAVLVIERYRYR
jgi:hypothetical protein